MFFGIAVLLTIVLLGLVFFVRPKDIPEPAPVSPYHHLDSRKAAIYENLRDLQFEFRVGKLSDEDYQRTKKDLQSELATVLAEIDRIKTGGDAGTPALSENGIGIVPQNASAKPAPSVKPNANSQPVVCPHCSASFDKPLKYCGECGKSMVVQA